MKALKESRKSSRRQPGTRGSNEGTGRKLGVPDESIVISAASSKGTGVKPGVPDEDKDITEEKDDQDKDVDVEKEGDADDEGDAHKLDEDDIYKYKIRLRIDKDKRMSNAEVAGSDKVDEEVSDAAKADAEKKSKVKDDAKKTKFPPSSSSLSISSGFGDQFLKTSFHISLIGNIKDSTDAEISSLMDVNIQCEVLQIQSPTVLRVLVYVITEPSVLTPILETPLATTVTTSPPLSVSTILLLRVANLEKDVSELKNLDISVEAFVALETHVPTIVDNYLGTKVEDSSKLKTPTINIKQESEKSPSEILKIKKEQAEKQQKPQFTIESTDREALKEFDSKSALYQHMHANKSFNRNPANHRLYHALMEALIEDENAMDKGVTDTIKDHKRKHNGNEDDDDEGPSGGPNQGKQTERRRTKESEKN
ncbi:hypothetical protein Tco_0931287 [Tanacetum coccineum]